MRTENSRPAWDAYQVQGQPVTHNETVAHSSKSKPNKNLAERHRSLKEMTPRTLCLVQRPLKFTQYSHISVVEHSSSVARTERKDLGATAAPIHTRTWCMKTYGLTQP